MLTKFCFFLPFGHDVSPSGEVLDACAARGRGGSARGCAPFAAPLASPPNHPLRGAFNFLSVARARVLCCGSFPHSLRSLR